MPKYFPRFDNARHNISAVNGLPVFDLCREADVF